MSFLGLEGLHVFVTGAAGGIGGQAVREFLSEFYAVRIPTSKIARRKVSTWEFPLGQVLNDRISPDS
jgi:uncharacterized protein YbjT (DUF2867 family)